MLRSQVGMLIPYIPRIQLQNFDWPSTYIRRWDITLAMISRRGLVIDMEHVKHVTLHEGQDLWSFFDITGSPGELICFLAELVDLAKQGELAATMTWLTFNVAPVFGIERAIKQWQSTEPKTPDFTNSSHTEESHDIADDTTLEEQYQQQHDRYHCAEAWRCTLLLYIRRTLLWDRQSSPPMILKQLARETIDHIRCCRRTSQTQEQLLLLVFLATSETKDDELRQFCRDYCGWWSNRSRHNMFSNVPILLDKLWAKESVQDRRPWWELIVNEETLKSN